VAACDDGNRPLVLSLALLSTFSITRHGAACAQLIHNTIMSLTAYAVYIIIGAVPWEVEYTDEFEAWWDELSEQEQDKIAAAVLKIRDLGPNLGFPFSSDVRQSRHPRMRELRVQVHGKPLRILYAFDPRRVGILLIGGDKTGNDRWYETYVPMADRLYDEHLETIAKEQRNKGESYG
jgi:hypothetical protein